MQTRKTKILNVQLAYTR